MIPKVIHYCWFGRGEKSKLMKKCIKSWKKYCPDYEIIEWNEDNFDIKSAPLFVREAYEAKKWAFVSDYVRLFALKSQGGVYFDTDVEVIKNIDKFLYSKAFIGYECPGRVGTGIMAATAQHPFISECISRYDGQKFMVDGKMCDIPNVVMVTDVLENYGFDNSGDFQRFGDVDVYPQEYFCPNPYEKIKNRLNKNTYTVHYLDSSWRSKKGRSDLKRALRHNTWWYRLYEYIKVLPQRIVRILFGNETIDRLKNKLR